MFEQYKRCQTIGFVQFIHYHDFPSGHQTSLQDLYLNLNSIQYLQLQQQHQVLLTIEYLLRIIYYFQELQQQQVQKMRTRRTITHGAMDI